MTRNQNYDEASSKKRIKTTDIWSDLNHDMLFEVMMELGVIDYYAFSRVCKSWRSVAVLNKNKFIVSRPPMSVSISPEYDHEKKCHLVDYEGRELKIILPHSAGRRCIGVTCGYLILCCVYTRYFWLVNPITRHDLHFPFPSGDLDVRFYLILLRAVLVFSPSISGWVLVVFKQGCENIWFCVAGKREWTCVSTLFPIFCLQAFKGKIYALSSGNRLGEVRLSPTPKVTLLEIKNLPNPSFSHPIFVSLGENLYAMDFFPKKIHEIDLSKMEWVSFENAGEEYGLFLSLVNHISSIIRGELLADYQSKYEIYAHHDKSAKLRFWYEPTWYFFHDCLDVNLLRE